MFDPDPLPVSAMLYFQGNSYCGEVSSATCHSRRCNIEKVEQKVTEQGACLIALLFAAICSEEVRLKN